MLAGFGGYFNSDSARYRSIARLASRRRSLRIKTACGGCETLQVAPRVVSDLLFGFVQDAPGRAAQLWYWDIGLRAVSTLAGLGLVDPTHGKYIPS